MEHAPIRYPVETPPAPGMATELAPGVLWIRLPLPMALDHVNVYALDDPGGWTLIDTGLDTARARAVWERLLSGPLAGRPVRRVIVTHHHPDHIGLAGWFQSAHDAELVTTRTAWLMARMLCLDIQDRPTEQAMRFYRRAGMDAPRLARRARDRPFNFADVVAPLPLGYTRICQGDTIRAGGRTWRVEIGHGHAPEQATLWSESDNLILGADQLLPSISPNIGLYPTEPNADPLTEWLDSCHRMAGLASEDHFVLPGHKLPFRGLPMRLSQLIDNHHGALGRLETRLKSPATATQCFPTLFKREIAEGEYGLALVEAMAHLNHLYLAGRITRDTDSEGAWQWRLAPG